MEKEADHTKNELTLKELILKSRVYFNFLKSKWLIILICGLLGGAGSLALALLKKPIYTATCTFVLDGAGGSGISNYAGLASLAGIDLSNKEGSVFAGDNIVALYTSRNMIIKTLLCKANFDGKPQLLIDRYINFLKLRKAWAKDTSLNHISFQGPANKFGRKQDSLLISIATSIDKGILTVAKPDKKLSIIEVDVRFGDELFAKSFNDNLVANVNDFYIKTKTKKTAANVQILQKQADSVKAVLNNSISGIASSLDASPNANPLLLSLKVPSQKKQVDLQSSSAIYAEIVKNLELAEISLRQETPLIQVIDEPLLPLTVEKPRKTRSLILGGILGGMCAILYLLFKRGFKNLMA
jgi:hypothetical protein